MIELKIWDELKYISVISQDNTLYDTDKTEMIGEVLVEWVMMISWSSNLVFLTGPICSESYRIVDDIEECEWNSV